MTPLQLHDIVIRRGRRVIVDRVSVTVAAGEIVAVIGDNGVGKSTLLSCIAGILAPASGTVLVDGESVWGARGMHARRQLGYVPEAADPPGHLTGAELWALVAATKQAPPPSDAVRSAFGLDELASLRLATMSLGQRRRACLGAAWIGSPRLLVLDEPDNGLDVARWASLVTALRAHGAAGGGAIVSSHANALVEQLGARLVTLPLLR